MRIRVLAVAAVVATALPIATAAPSPAARCVSGADVRQQVSAFVHSLKDDVAADARRAVRGALIETSRAAQGAHADTPRENRGLGKEISALARTLGDAADAVERKAIIAEIHALQAQKRSAHGDPAETLRADVAALARALGKQVDTKGEGRQVAAFAHAFMGQFAC